MILFLRFSNIYPIRIAVVQKYIKKSKVDQLFLQGVPRNMTVGEQFC